MTEQNAKFLTSFRGVIGFLIVFGLVQCSQQGISREILNSSRKPSNNKTQLSEKTEGQMEVIKNMLEEVLGFDRQLDSFTSIFTSISDMISSVFNTVFSIFGNIFGSLGNIGGSTGTGGSSGLGSLIPGKPGSGNGTSGCSLIDPLLIANKPGIFFGVPIILVGIAILIKVVAAIAVIIPSFTGPFFESLINNKNSNSGQGGYSQSSQYGAPSSSYGTPSSSYGSPSQYSNSRLTETVDGLTQDFAQAYDKYSNLQQQQQAYDNTMTMSQNQYNPSWQTQSIKKYK